MNVHQNARTTLWSRVEIVRRVRELGQSAASVAASFHVTPKTVRRWTERAARSETLQDRSGRPHSMPTATPPELIEQLERLRRQRWTSAEIAAKLRLGRSTVARLVRRLGLARLDALEPPPPVQRYEWARPGDLVHVDVKKLARIGHIGHRITGDRRRRLRGIGWEYAHVAVDDHSRLAYVEVLGDERGPTVARFLWRALAWFRRHGIRVRRVMTDNAFAYLGRAFAGVCQLRGLRHIRIRPYTPRTNGKAERFIRTLLTEWAYGRAYGSSAARTATLSPWLHYYNWHRPHTSLAGRPPINRLAAGDNLVRLHT
ncbi:MAG TPA: IS481 family transposase [Methylomirabilota bacterium]|nr:IS481 family transposase [Methylomirabilota bacterium]